MSNKEFNNHLLSILSSLKPVALKFTRNEEDAKDLLQETSMKALISKKKFKENTNLKAWVYTIMLNLFINNYRKKIKRQTYNYPLNELYEINFADSTVPNYGESNLNMGDVQKHLDKLIDDLRTPFLMYYRGFKYHEIASNLAIPEGTVKSRIHFARKKLKKSLDPAWSEIDSR